MKNFDATYKFAFFGICCSCLTLLGIIIFVPLLVQKANEQQRLVELMSTRFKERTDRLWNSMMTPSNLNLKLQKFSRKPRSFWGSNICSGCYSLSCPMGIAGPGGAAGADGSPGDPGRQGPPGADGFDVQLEQENDLPCVICPAGPPGQRGHQGERGRLGEKGEPGDQGPFGHPGTPGFIGKPGPRGPPGLKGPFGYPGPAGDMVVSGIGVKGAQGPIGPPGPKGPSGTPGKSSKIPGMAGKPGPLGPIGPPGQPGKHGEQGPWGPPGEPGEPASYCPSDCGVSQILAPSNIAQVNPEASAFGGYSVE